MSQKQNKPFKNAQENEQIKQQSEEEKEGLEITRQQIQNNYMDGTIDQLKG
ncbi:hypothetical protein [Paraliobacillus salinarum]|uniref:hypothetical protein n=1 Tax=Paraliobacillus salinarum TaxID=1158996 RepID=UPI0015F56885|nr:hypothetical protein [Paraliobacillus salinarum]